MFTDEKEPNVSAIYRIIAALGLTVSGLATASPEESVPLISGGTADFYTKRTVPSVYEICSIILLIIWWFQRKIISLQPL